MANQMDNYRELKAINATAIKAGARSMLHMHHALTGYKAESPAMRWGTLVHDLLLMRNPTRFAVYDGRRAGKDWEAFEAANNGRVIVNRTEWTNLQSVLESVNSNGEVAAMLNSQAGEREFAVKWKVDGNDGPFDCKARIDYFADGVLLDVKNAKDISERGFTLASWSAGTHLQIAWYRLALLYSGRKFSRAGIVAIESSAPYDCALYWYDERLLDWAEIECLKICEKYLAAKKAGKFSGAHQFAKTIMQPAFADELIQGLPDEEGDPENL